MVTIPDTIDFVFIGKIFQFLDNDYATTILSRRGIHLSDSINANSLIKDPDKSAVKQDGLVECDSGDSG
jgi:hypothetical protein